VTEDTENIESEGPTETEWTEPKDPMKDEEAEPATMIGAVTPGTIVSSTGMTISSGGWSTGGITYSPKPAPSTGTTTVYHPSAAKKKSLMVDLPKRVTKKVLIAFIDEDEEDPEENIVWAANLLLEDIDIAFDSMGEGRMTLNVLLRDHYGNKED
jgi:hypothetical protein